MNFSTPIKGPESHFEVWVQFALFRDGVRVHPDNPEPHDVSVGIRIVGKESMIVPLLESGNLDSIKLALEAYLNTLDACVAQIGIPQSVVVSEEDPLSSLTEQFYSQAFNRKLGAKITSIERYFPGINGETRGPKRHVVLS